MLSMARLRAPAAPLQCVNVTMFQLYLQKNPGEYPDPAAADIRVEAGDLGSGPGDQRGQAAAMPGRGRVLVILI